MCEEKMALTIQKTSPGFMVDYLTVEATFSYECDICCDIFTCELDSMSKRAARIVSKDMFGQGWREVTYPGHLGVACPECIKKSEAGTLTY